ncbi:DNA mismatch repair endonuclease MutL [Geotoga petraea]|jgi:DNA mismatch repair protein MutL|uniref:DNA mismatch repair protein MutL n=1 Tax=Geotoga petraea TaxID=28234 RepID=A0A4Z0VZ68_9BACT|nr:DNA mismatch repair endonuclease MutL [Geotoga petraea]TGG87214.1 DNA mismatch repair endonuclease MutL [Geotoga petraea]
MRIKKLPDDIIVKIAAGEVISGTYNVVKELIENSIDAGADKIRVEIIDGGKSKIVVEDNGDGMSLEEMRIAVKPHTTSKIDKFDDLYSINSFGFRGEALASISEISRMSISSKKENDLTGYEIFYIGGKEVEVKEVTKNKGTKIEVNDLFFNIPARRKFLKSSSSESRKVTDIVEKFILSENIDFEYIRNGKEIYKFYKNDKHTDKIITLFPELKLEDLIEINQNIGWGSIKGFISNPKTTRGNRSAQIFFVNKRYVKEGDLFSVFERSYGEMLDKGRHPYGVLFINVLPDNVDVNVHPQKLEVKFSDQNIIMKDMKNILRENLVEKTKFNLNFEKIEKNQNIENQSDERKRDLVFDNSDYKSKSNFENGYNTSLYNNEGHQEKIHIKEPIKDYGYSNEFFEKKKVNDTISTNFQIENSDSRTNNKRIIGVANTRYLIIEDEDQIIIMDFHAAHERVIFEKLKKQFFTEKRIKKNKLLIPIEIRVSFEEKEEINEHREIINQIGLNFSFENEIMKIETLPLGIKVKNPKAMIREILDTLKLKGIESLEKIHEDALATMACRSAVKTGDDVVGLEKLVSDVFEMKLKTCPHGRPIMMNMPYKKLDDFFGR